MNRCCVLAHQIQRAEAPAATHTDGVSRLCTRRALALTLKACMGPPNANPRMLLHCCHTPGAADQLPTSHSPSLCLLFVPRRSADRPVFGVGLGPRSGAGALSDSNCSLD